MIANDKLSNIFIPATLVAGYNDFTLVIRVFIFSFPDDNLSKYQWIFSKLGMCIDIREIWFEIDNRQNLTRVIGPLLSVLTFPDDNLSKYRWIFTKLGMCIDIVVIWFWIANGRIICPQPSAFLLSDNNMSKHEWIFTKLGMSIGIVDFWFDIANGQTSSVFDRVCICRHTVVAGYYRFTVLFSFLLQCFVSNFYIKTCYNQNVA